MSPLPTGKIAYVGFLLASPASLTLCSCYVEPHNRALGPSIMHCGMSRRTRPAGSSYLEPVSTQPFLRSSKQVDRMMYGRPKSWGGAERCYPVCKHTLLVIIAGLRLTIKPCRRIGPQAAAHSAISQPTMEPLLRHPPCSLFSILSSRRSTRPAPVLMVYGRAWEAPYVERWIPYKPMAFALVLSVSASMGQRRSATRCYTPQGSIHPLCSSRLAAAEACTANSSLEMRTLLRSLSWTGRQKPGSETPSW